MTSVIISVAAEVSNQIGGGHFVSSYNMRTRRRLRYEGEYMNFKKKISTRKKLMLKAVSLPLVHSADLKRCTCIYVQTENGKSITLFGLQYSILNV